MEQIVSQQWNTVLCQHALESCLISARKSPWGEVDSAVCAGLASCQKVFSNASVDARPCPAWSMLSRVKDALLGCSSGMLLPGMGKTWRLFYERMWESTPNYSCLGYSRVTSLALALNCSSRKRSMYFHTGSQRTTRAGLHKTSLQTVLQRGVLGMPSHHYLQFTRSWVLKSAVLRCEEHFKLFGSREFLTFNPF